MPGAASADAGLAGRQESRLVSGSPRPAATPSAAPTARPRPWLLLLWLAAMLAGVGWIAQARFSTDLSAFLPARPDARQRLLVEQLQEGVGARTLFIGIEGANAAARARASLALGDRLRASGRFVQVANGDRAADAAMGRWLFEHRYLLGPAVEPARFTAAGLRDAIDETLSLLGTPAGQALKPLLERDPTGEMQRLAEVLIPAQAPRVEDGVWVSRDAPRAVLLAVTRAAGADLDAQALALAQLRADFAAVAAQSPGLRLQASGAGVFSVASRDRIEGEVKQLLGVGVLVVGGLLLAAFASPLALALAWLPVATGVVAGTVAVSIVFGVVHGLTLGFGCTLIGETVDYAIYYLIQARGAAGASPGSGWRRWRERGWPTVRWGLATSVCGFAALAFSGFPGLAQLGVFSIAGLVAAALGTRHVLPVLVPDGAAGQGLRRRMARLAGAALQALPRLRGAVLAAALAAAALLVWHGGGLWRGDLQSLGPVPAELLALDAALRNDVGASDARTLVVAQGTDAAGALAAAEAAGIRLDALVADGVLAGYDTPSRLLPSAATQRARLASLPDAATLRARLAEATAGGPLAAARLAPFIADVEAARRRGVVAVDEVRAGPLAPLLDAMLHRRADGGWSAVLALQPGPRFDATLLGRALAPLDGVQVLDIRSELDYLYRGYLHEALWLVTLGALAVVAVLGACVRSPRRLLAVCRPLALAPLLTLGGFALAGAALGLLHLVGLLLVVAVGSNYALFFDQLQHGAGDAVPDDDMLASLLLANLATVATFGLVALSALPSLAAIGRIVAPGALLALLLAAVFAPRRAGRR